MFSKHIVLLALICACAVPIDNRGQRVPRGWTLDTSKQEIGAINVREQKAFGESKIIRADDFSAESLTTEATLSPADSKEQLKHLIEKYNKLLCANNALKETKLKFEDERCFRTLRAVEQLEVHVSTSVSALRNESKWPEFTVELGGMDEGFYRGEEPIYAHALDGGTVVFRKMFPIEKVGDKIEDYYNMVELISEIKLILKTTENDSDETNDETSKYVPINDYVVVEESFGPEICIERKWIELKLNCIDSSKKQQQTDYTIETNRLHIDRVEIYLYFANDDRPYKVFASHSSAQEPLAILDNIVRDYSIVGFENNPHWLLHYHSAKCDAWQGDHDGSEFGDYIWDYIDNPKKQALIDIYSSPLRCTGTITVPIYAEPEIPKLNGNDDDAIEAWLKDNKASFKPHANNNKSECQPRTAAVIKKEAMEQNKCGKEPAKPMPVFKDLDTWSAARLSNAVRKTQDAIRDGNEGLEPSNETYITEINRLTGSGCFYEKQLLGGIEFAIAGQMLLNVNGMLMTRHMAEEKIFNDKPLELPDIIDKNHVYINLGFNAQSYPVNVSINSRTGESHVKEIINEDYTRNFALRDIGFVHLEKTAHEDFFSYATISKVIHDKFWSPWGGWREDKAVPTASATIEQGIIAIHGIELKFNDDVIYSLGSVSDSTSAGTANENGVFPAKFMLTSSNNVWIDYNLRGNEAWTKYRDKTDHCTGEE